MPDRSARLISRPIASTSAISAPPALPRLMNTSNGCPRSSSVMLTYRVPSGVSTRRVVPRRVSGRERFCRRWRFSASRSCIALCSRSFSARTSASSPWRSAIIRLPAVPACCATRSARASDLPRADGLLLHLLRRAAGREHLHVAAAVAVDGHALAVELVRQLVDLLDVRPRSRRVAKLHGLADGASRCTPGTPPASGCATRA